MSRLMRALTTLAAVALLAVAWLWHVNYNDGVKIDGDGAPPDSPELRARGAYLARVGNCMACHTARGGEPGAGGLPVSTPFGTIFTSNLTPDPETGIGRWSSAAFWRALHHGRSADGRLLYPVFPYTHTTALTREDSDALLAHFRTLAPVHRQVPAHDLRWPYNLQAGLAVWRALYFKPGLPPALPSGPAGADLAIQRGAYLVHAVAHCSACHAPRDALGGGDWQDLSGGLMPTSGWYAPSLTSPREAALGDWPADEIVRLLKTGVASQGHVSGPMAEVVGAGTQYMTDDDLHAIAAYLKALPQQVPPRAAPPAPSAARSQATVAGAKLYEQHCAACHGEQGEGVPNAYPPLAGNRAVTMAHTENLLQIVLYGGFGAATAAHPRPYGMPPFTLALTDAEIAAVLSTIRTSWGNHGTEVSPLEVHRMRAGAGAPPR
jgi:mono/diheme cytochrome c family protein